MSNFLAALGNIGLSAGSSLLSGAIGNHFARQNMREAQQWQEKMYGEQKQFWYDQQEYLSPENQMQRLRDAGINPNFVLGNIQTGSVGSSPSVGSPSPAQTVAFGDAAQNFAAITGAKTQKRLADADIRLRESDAVLKEIDAYTRAFDNLSNIYEKLSKIDKNKADTVKSMMESWATGVSTRMEWMLGNQNIKESEQRIENMVTENLIKEEELKVLPQRLKLDLQEISADIALKVATKQFTLQQARTEWYKQAKISFEATHQRYTNELLHKTFNALVDKAYNDEYWSRFNPRMSNGWSALDWLKNK